MEDLCSRQIVGWSMSAGITSRLVVDVLEMAVSRRLPGAGLVAHSDRGSQYASDHYQRLWKWHGITCSKSRRGDCWDNAPRESFFASLKKEIDDQLHVYRRSSAMRATVILFGLFAVFVVSDSIRGDTNPGLKAVADSSTDIAVMEVLDSNPSKAKEGARDTARFKVIRTLKGPLLPGDEIGVYYHLLWVDSAKGVLEKPKFEKGKRYTVFLVNSRGYTLTDQWLAVLPEQPRLDQDVAHALNEVGDLWDAYWRQQHKGPLASRRRIEILPDAKVSRTKNGLTLSVRIVNHSAQEITTRLAHEWHGGEWPSTDLYASATHVQAKQAKPLVPVFLKGEQQHGTKLTRIAPGKSITVELRMDWPGTGSQRAAPLLSPSESESKIRVLMVFDTGGNAREYAASAVKYVRIADE